MNDPTRRDSESTDPAPPQATSEEAVSPEEAASDDAAPEKAAYDTVEEAVRAQLSKALGGARGVVEAAIPTIGFTVSWIVTKELKLSLGIGAGLAVALLFVRLAQRSTVQFVLNSIFGIAIAALFALRSGKAEDAFLPGILYNAGYAAAMFLSIAVRWPLVGFIIGSDKSLTCSFKPSKGGKTEHYSGTIKKLGLDIGFTAGSKIAWLVFAAEKNGWTKHALAGTYVGASSEATLGVGLGGNWLIGGSKKSFALQPWSIQGQIGLNLSWTWTALTLE